MATNDPMMCETCGVAMNHHAEKVDYAAALERPELGDPELAGFVEEIHTCPGCGAVASRPGM